MSDLTAFLLARIAEDEIWARDVGGTYYSEPYDQGAPAHHERLIAECEAKRLIVEDFEEYARDARDDPSSEFARGRRHAALLAVTRVAAAYADHPDYREEWRP